MVYNTIVLGDIGRLLARCCLIFLRRQRLPYLRIPPDFHWSEPCQRIVLALMARTILSALLIVLLTVGRNILQEIMRNGADGQNTDVRPQTPTKATYADIAKLPIRMSSLRVRGA
jgi:hypothetical protein